MRPTIGVVGRGFVGGAIVDGFRKAVDVMSWDKHKGWAEFRGDKCVSWTLEEPGCWRELVEKARPIFVCVPTPMAPDGSCHVDIVFEVLEKMNEAAAGKTNKPLVVIKSTIPPGTTDYLSLTYTNLSLAFSPEFLREATAEQDFAEQDRVILGCHRPTDYLELVELFRLAFPNARREPTTPTVAEMVKYVTNCFLAVKVSFANEIALLCEKMGIDYQQMIEIAALDERLGDSHWQVPGPDGQRGWGGSCFPKDLSALIHVAQTHQTSSLVMQAAWQINSMVRSECGGIGARSEEQGRTEYKPRDCNEVAKPTNEETSSVSGDASSISSRSGVDGSHLNGKKRPMTNEEIDRIVDGVKVDDD